MFNNSHDSTYIPLFFPRLPYVTNFSLEVHEFATMTVVTVNDSHEGDVFLHGTYMNGVYTKAHELPLTQYENDVIDARIQNFYQHQFDMEYLMTLSTKVSYSRRYYDNDGCECGVIRVFVYPDMSLVLTSDDYFRACVGMYKDGTFTILSDLPRDGQLSSVIQRMADEQCDLSKHESIVHTLDFKKDLY